MAYNKECLIVVLDVRNCATEDFKLKSIKCVAEIIKEKIVSAKKDYISFVLVGTENSDNERNHPNIVQYPSTQLCNWQLLISFFKFVNETSCDDGEWLDALDVATNMLDDAQRNFKCARQRILLLFDFNFMTQKYASYADVTQNIFNAGIDLIVGAHNIAYIDNPESSQAQAIFKSSRKVGSFELENQKYALQLVSNCNATLCNFKETLSTVFKVQNKSPWSWNCKLHIGSQIIISLQGIIAMKDESNIKLEKRWGEHDETVTREIQHFIKGTEITPRPEDLINGYMLGGTAVPYDNTLVEPKPPHPAGLHFVGFVQRSSIPDEYYCGDSLYMLVHQKGNAGSARKLDALVRALQQQQRVMLCWKIYSIKLNTPRIVVLLPNELSDERPATLSMLELSYHAQHHFWDFPALRTVKTECTAEQLQAVDQLIDSMDLECTLKDTQQPRQLRKNDLLPFDQLPNIYEQNVMDVLERNVLCQMADDEQFLEMLQDKNFVEVYWKVPEALEEKAKAAAKQLKLQFPLEQSEAWKEKLKAQQLKELLPHVKQEKMDNVEANATMLTFDAVGLRTPAEDYAQLLEHKVRTLKHNTQRDAKFQSYAAQMRVVILTLLQRSKLNLAQLSEILELYRKSCLEFNAFVEYEKFADELKAKAVERNQREFWNDVMVAKQLGPLVPGEPTLDDELNLQAYYSVETWRDEITVENALDDDMDELLAAQQTPI